ncbi:MAG: FMN-binding negative transcriptional regulator [Betaproteobacteria bacterium]|nr:MAG: FMN-binding negative transcriptional regulator [Betaproteobacteria bacterium]
MIYIPDQFRISDREMLFRIMRENSFATLITCSGKEPMVAHIPVTVNEANDLLQAHVARADPIWQEFSPDREVMFIFHGPHHYVSPSWYTAHPSVPTWNYAVVHASGLPTIIDDHGNIEKMLRRLVDEHESPSETPWRMDLPVEYLQSMIDAAVAFEVQITSIQGKFKLSQNRCHADRSKVIAVLKRVGSDSASRLAALMAQILKS